MAFGYFAESYAEARQKFCDAATAAGAILHTFANPAAGPAGEALATDVALVGPEKAERLLVLSSGTHGVEGFCGSGCQIGILRSGLAAQLPERTAVLLVHAINPHGFAHQRRVTEDNVDLNRNFIDHSRPPPANPAYDEVHRLLLPADWDGPARAAADRAIIDYVTARGHQAFQAAVTGGQYGHADGLFYGGRAPTWSNRTLREIVRRFAAGRQHVAMIDFHTGLGPRGYGEPIFAGTPDTPEHRRAIAWYGDEVTCPEAGNSTSAPVQGTVSRAYEEGVGEATFTGLALEYGTVSVMEVINALRADHWLYKHGKVDSPQGAAIKAEIRAAFYVEVDDWKEMVWARAREMTEKALVGLAAS